MDAAQAAFAFAEVHRGQLVLAVVAFVVMLVATLAGVAFVVVRMPADYLVSSEAPPFWPGRPAWLRLLARIGKNVVLGPVPFVAQPGGVERLASRATAGTQVSP